MTWRWIAATTWMLIPLVVGVPSAWAQEPEDSDKPPEQGAPVVAQEPAATDVAQEEGTPPEVPRPETAQQPTATPATERDEEAWVCPPCATGLWGDDPSEGGPSLRYLLEKVEVRGNLRTRERVVLRYMKLRQGDVLDVDDPELELMRYRLLGTGFFRSVNLSLRKGSRRGHVILVVDVAERNTIIVSDLWMGLSADADTQGNARPLTAYAGADVAETNLGGTGITLGAGMGFAQDQLALRTRFFDPAFLGTSWMTSATLLYNDARDFYGNRDVLYDDPLNATQRVEDYAVAQYKRFGGTVGVGHDVGLPVQLWLDYRLERIDATLPLAASHRRGLDIEPISFGLHRGLSVLSTLRGTLIYDTRDSPFLPTKGSHTTFAADVALAPLGSSYSYQKFSLNTSRWMELPWQHVLRLGFFGGAIAGDAPIYERYYVGDFSDFLPSRMLDLNTDRRPAPNFLDTSIVEVRYGEYAAELMGEYRVPLYRGHRAVYGVDLFGSAGIYGVAQERDLRDPPRGYDGFERVPVDLTFNLGLRIDTSAGGFTFAFSNVLGFIPVRGEASR